MRYAFIAEHRDRFGVRAMCRCLAVQPSGYYAWQKSPLSQRAREDARLTDLIRKVWSDSGKVYGYRKLHDDLLDHGETCCPNRVARLTKLAGIRAPGRLQAPALAATVASRPWRSTTRWIASLTWPRPTAPG